MLCLSLSKIFGRLSYPQYIEGAVVSLVYSGLLGLNPCLLSTFRSLTAAKHPRAVGNFIICLQFNFFLSCTQPLTISLSRSFPFTIMCITASWLLEWSLILISYQSICDFFRDHFSPFPFKLKYGEDLFPNLFYYIVFCISSFMLFFFVMFSLISLSIYEQVFEFISWICYFFG